MARLAKRFVILLVFLLIIGGIGFLFYQNSYAPTCFDNIQNGKEEGIDCGTIACGVACSSPIQPISIESIMSARPNSSADVAIQIYNPNTEHGAVSGTYDLIVEDSSGQEVNRLSGNTFYMLPGQTKYLVRTAVYGLATGNVSAEIKSVEWEKVVSSPDIQFSVFNDQLSVADGQTIYEASVSNNSDFDFDNVDIYAIVSSPSGSLIATNQTNIQTFLSRSSRYVKMTWPFELPSDARVYVQAETNIFNNINFLRRNGTQEKFQQFY